MTTKQPALDLGPHWVMHTKRYPQYQKPLTPGSWARFNSFDLRLKINRTKLGLKENAFFLIRNDERKLCIKIVSFFITFATLHKWNELYILKVSSSRWIHFQYFALIFFWKFWIWIFLQTVTFVVKQHVMIVLWKYIAFHPGYAQTFENSGEVVCICH